MGETSFSDELWAGGEAIYHRILEHPFLTGLADGSLSTEAFGYFLVQDHLYLEGYGRALALTAARMDDPSAMSLFAQNAAEVVQVERDLHRELFAELGIGADDLARAVRGPVTTAYTSYLLATCATGSAAEAVAAVLPCYWVYHRVGRALAAASSPRSLYALWIDAYSSDDFTATVQAVLSVTDALGAELGPAGRDRCRTHFTTTTRYEWMFFDAAHRQLSWPV